MLTTILTAVDLKNDAGDSVGGVVLCQEGSGKPRWALPFVFHGLDEAEAFVSSTERTGVDIGPNITTSAMRDRVALWRDARRPGAPLNVTIAT